MKTISTIIFLLVINTLATTRGPLYRDIRRMGMGLSGLALADNGSAIFYNPAGLNLYDKHMTLYADPLRFGFGNAFTDLIDFLINNLAFLSDPTNPTQEVLDDFAKIDGQWSTFSYSPEARFNTKNFGVGLTMNFQPRISLESGLYMPKIGIGTSTELVKTDINVAAGISKRFARIYSVGVAAKYFYRIDKATGYLGVDSAIIFGNDAQSAFGSIGAIKDFAQPRNGVGIDIGLIRHAGLTKYALVLQDFPTWLSNKVVHPSVNVGVGHHMGLVQIAPGYGNFLQNIGWALDVLDWFGPGSFFLKIHGGVEIELSNFIFRTGINQGYFTFGSDARFGIFKISYVRFVEELGKYPGQIKEGTHMATAVVDITF